MAEKKKSLSERDIIALVKRNTKNMLNRKEVFYSSGLVALDMVLTNGRGIPQGAAIEMYGKPGCGKTTILACLAKNLMETEEANGTKNKLLWIDKEHNFDLLANSMGLRKYFETGQIIYVDYMESLEELETYTKTILEPKDEFFENIKWIILDSITELNSEILSAKAISDGDFGTNAKVRGRYYQNYLPGLRAKDITSFFIAQSRTKMGAQQFEKDYKAATNKTDEHRMDIIMILEKKSGGSDSKVKMKTLNGVQDVADKFKVNISTYKESGKNRYGRVPDIEVYIKAGKGVSNIFTVRQLLEANGLAKHKQKNSNTLSQEFLTKFECNIKNKKTEEPEVVTAETVLTEKQYNSIVRFYLKDIVEWLREKDMYKAIIEVTDEEADLFE